MSEHLGLIGTGNMGGAIVQGLAGRRDLQVHGYDPDRERLNLLQDRFALIPEAEAAELARKCGFILLAVKPALMPGVLKELAPHLSSSSCLISVAAGVRIRDISLWSGNICPVVRVMPNTPALVGRGIFALCLEHELLSVKQADFVSELFAGLGQIHVLQEKDFDSFTALIGSGPAYVFYFMESMVDAGVLTGLGRREATQMVVELFAGTARMALQEDCHITVLKEMVASPAGTTITGLKSLERHAVKAAIMEAVESAALRSSELAKDKAGPDD